MCCAQSITNAREMMAADADVMAVIIYDEMRTPGVTEEFFEVYKGVLPEFVGMIEAMTLGPCIVMEIR